MKILLVTKNWLGDILFEIPAMDMIRKRYPSAEIICLTHPRCREILELHPSIDRVIAFDEKKSSILEKFRLILNLRREKIEQAYFFHRSRTRAFMLMLAGIPNRIGYGIKKPNFLTQAILEPKDGLHHVDYFTQMLEQADFEKSKNPQYTFYFSKQDLETAKRIISGKRLQNFVCFHLGANWEPKRWLPEHFAKLAELIHEKWKLPIVLTGGPGDKDLGERVLRNVQEARVFSLIGETSLGELAALFNQSVFVVSGDSGPMHIASGVGARVLALFGPTDPLLTGPRGTGETIVLTYVPKGYRTPWYGKDFPKEGWLSQIQPETVMASLEAKNWGSGGNYSSRGFFELRESKDVSERSILVNTLSNIGDVILTTPVMMSLVKQYPGHPLTVIVGPRAKGILDGSVNIKRLVIYDKQASLGEKIKFVKELRREKYEVAVDLKNSAIPFLVSAKKRSPLFRSFKKISAREKHLEVLDRMGLCADSIPQFDFYNAQEEISAINKLREKGNISQGWIVIAPVAASEIKTWPLASYQKVIEGLLRETSYSIVLAGGPREASLVEPLVSLSPSRIFNMAGETSLREFAALIGKSELLIANDSSAAQLGFEMNHPTAVIFGPTDPKKFAREGEAFRILYEKLPCVPCEQSTCRLARQECLLDLNPEKVLNACLELLAKNRVKTVHGEGKSSS